MSNTRPIMQVSTVTNNRGRVFECRRCDTDPYQGEKSKVILHIYRKHTALDQVPFYCNICKFVTTTKTDLVKHVNPSNYPSHQATVKAMSENGELVNEEESLLQNVICYNPSESDYRRFTKTDSKQIFEERKRAPKSIQTRDDAATNDLLRNILMKNNIPTTTPSDRTTDILPAMLARHQLSDCNFTLSTHTPPTPQLPKNYAAKKPTHTTDSATKPTKKPTHTTDSATKPTKKPSHTSEPATKVNDKTIHDDNSTTTTSSTSSSTTQCKECPIILQEVSGLRKEVKTMATAMGEMIKEMEQLRKAVDKQQTPHTLQPYREKENHPYRRPQNYRPYNRDNNRHY